MVLLPIGKNGVTNMDIVDSVNGILGFKALANITLVTLILQ